MDKKALIELGKSFARFIWFGLLGLVGTFLASLIASGQLENVYVSVGGLYINISFVILAVVTGVIKAIDKYVHESKAIPSNGIAPSFLQK